jgi:hypothetical protein
MDGASRFGEQNYGQLKRSHYLRRNYSTQIIRNVLSHVHFGILYEKGTKVVSMNFMLK